MSIKASLALVCAGESSLNRQSHHSHLDLSSQKQQTWRDNVSDSRTKNPLKSTLYHEGASIPISFKCLDFALFLVIYPFILYTSSPAIFLFHASQRRCGVAPRRGAETMGRASDERLAFLTGTRGVDENLGSGIIPPPAEVTLLGAFYMSR